MKTLLLKAIIVLLFCSVLLSGCNLLAGLANGYQDDAPPVVTKNPTLPPGNPAPGIEIYFEPQEITVAANQPFNTELHVNVTNTDLLAYDLRLVYDNKIVTVDTEQDEQGIEVSENITSFINTHALNTIMLRSNNIPDLPGNSQSYIFKIYWLAGSANGTCNLIFEVNSTITVDPPVDTSVLESILQNVHGSLTVQ